MKILKKIGFLVATGAMAVGVGVSFLAHGEIQTSAASTLYSTCDFTTKATAHTGYSDSWAYATDWNVFGGQNNNGGWAYIRLGGKSATLATANPVYVNNVAAMGEAINKVSVSLMVGTLSAGTMSVTNYGVKVYSDAALTTQIDDSSLTNLVKPTVAVTYDFAPSTAYQTANSTTVWPSGSYFKVYFTCTNTSTTNGIVYLDKISFYKDAPLVAVTSVTVEDPESTEMTVGTTLTLTTTVLPADATDKTVTWSSSNEVVAAIDSAGKIMPLANGTVRMTATSVADNTKSDYIDLTVSGQDVSTTAKTITTTSLGLVTSYTNGYYGTGTVYSLRGVMAKAVGGELQFGNNATAGQGLFYNVSEY
ncbi:MAG: Ig-like domain-containing protein, partial [Bacilli bacterium]